MVLSDTHFASHHNLLDLQDSRRLQLDLEGSRQLQLPVYECDNNDNIQDSYSLRVVVRIRKLPLTKNYTEHELRGRK